MPASAIAAAPMNGSCCRLGHDTTDHLGGRRSLQRQQCAVVVRFKLHAGWQIGGDMGEVDLLPAGVDHQEQPVASDIRHHQVIEDAARLVGEQRIALPTRFQPQYVARHQPLQRCGGGGTRQACLAHVRDIEQRGMCAAVQMLGQNALILERHRIAGELDHASPERAVPGIERHGLQWLGVGIVRQRVLDQWSAPQEVMHRRCVPMPMTPLCRGT